MSQPWLVLDCHYLCHRAFHTAKDLAWKGKSTGVVFSFLKSIGFMKDEFQTDRIVFCFENPILFRRDIYPSYKVKRVTKERTEKEKEEYSNLCIQISDLRQRYLPEIGFKNIFSFRGMESDDIMAQIARSVPDTEDVILVTSDQDLYQCLKHNVTIFSPSKKQIITESWFRKTYGIRPSKWAVVKAIAGCQSDEVKGVGGVGEATALKYLLGELKPESKAYETIKSEEGRAIVRRNRKLVELPYEDCPVPELQDDDISKAKWLEVCNQLGMRSIAQRPPVAARRTSG